jgi:hypothetical protein
VVVSAVVEVSKVVVEAASLEAVVIAVVTVVADEASPPTRSRVAQCQWDTLGDLNCLGLLRSKLKSLTGLTATRTIMGLSVFEFEGSCCPFLSCNLGIQL